MQQDRRKFITDSIKTTVASAAAPMFIPRKAWGANDKMAYGMIGAGGRGRYLSRVFQKLGAQCVAIGEVYDLNTEQALKDAPDAKTYIEYRELLQQSGIDFDSARFLAQFPGFSKDILGGDEHVVTTLLALFSVGIGVGSLLCERMSGRKVELGLSRDARS